MHHAPPQKDQAGDNHPHAQPFKEADHQGVETPQGLGKDAVGAQEAVEQDFEQFQVDEHKAHVDQNMKKGRNRAAAHFGLTQGNTGHLAPAQGGSVGGRSPLPTENIGPNTLNSANKGVKPANEDRGEEQGLEQLKTH